MQTQTKNDLIDNYIFTNYDVKSPIFIKDFYKEFPEISRSTIRSIVKRKSDKGEIVKIDNGIYGFPNQSKILNQQIVNVSNIIEQKYIKRNNKRIGYISGLNVGNLLGLTTQIARVETIITNTVRSPLREIDFMNRRLNIGKPVVKVNEQNYRLLQILDLLYNFEKYSEYSLEKATPTILEYLKNTRLSKNEMINIIRAYPILAQVKFYMIGGDHVIAQ